MVIHNINEKGEEQIERKRSGNPPEGHSPLNPMADKQVHIVCPEHGPFQMSWENHIGNNKEKIAYGCPKCNRDWVLLELSLCREDYLKLKTASKAFQTTAKEQITELIRENYRQNGGSYEVHLDGRGEQDHE